MVTENSNPHIKYVATCNTWLAKDEGDRQISRELILTKQGGTTQRSETKHYKSISFIEYTISIYR